MAAHAFELQCYFTPVLSIALTPEGQLYECPYIERSNILLAYLIFKLLSSLCMVPYIKKNFYAVGVRPWHYSPPNIVVSSIISVRFAAKSAPSA